MTHNMKFKQLAAVVLISASTAIGSVWSYNRFIEKDTYHYEAGNGNGKLPVNYAGFFDGVTGKNAGPADFTDAAAAGIPATVHINTKTTARASNNLPRRSPFSDLFGDGIEDFFGDRMRSMPQQASGSGVIISQDGY